MTSVKNLKNKSGQLICKPAINYTEETHPHEQSCQPVTFKKSIIELKKTYFEVKKSIFARGARITSAKFFRPGSRARLRALEAHGF